MGRRGSPDVPTGRDSQRLRAGGHGAVRRRLRRNTYGSGDDAEVERLVNTLDRTGWDGGVERVTQEAGLKPFEAMGEADERGWLASRVGELAPERDLEVPVTDDGRPDWSQMSDAEQAEFMAAGAGGTEFEDL